MIQYQDADQYKDCRNLQARQGLHAKYATKDWFEWLADHLDLSENVDILDIGCGAGWFWSSAAFGHSKSRLTLSDASENLLAEAVTRLSADRRFNTVTGHVADAACLPFDDASFDVATAMHMLYHVTDQEKAVSEIARVLRPGGFAAVTTNGSDNMHTLFDVRREAFGATESDPAAAAFSIERGKDLLERHFNSVTVHMFEDTYAVDDPEDILAYIISFPPGNQASGAQCAQALRLITKRLGEMGGVLNVKRQSALICAA